MLGSVFERPAHANRISPPCDFVTLCANGGPAAQLTFRVEQRLWRRGRKQVRQSRLKCCNHKGVYVWHVMTQGRAYSSTRGSYRTLRREQGVRDSHKSGGNTASLRGLVRQVRRRWSDARSQGEAASGEGAREVEGCIIVWLSQPRNRTRWDMQSPVAKGCAAASRH
jgi:hypothetical protein